MKYRVIPITSQDPTDGFATLTNPYDPSSSPNGWHQYGNISTTTTSGNNVVAYKSNPDNGTTSQSSDTNNYEYSFSSTNILDVTKDVSTVNAFYLGNMMHDLLYQYGESLNLIHTIRINDIAYIQDLLKPRIISNATITERAARMATQCLYPSKIPLVLIMPTL